MNEEEFLNTFKKHLDIAIESISKNKRKNYLRRMRYSYAAFKIHPFLCVFFRGTKKLQSSEYIDCLEYYQNKKNNTHKLRKKMKEIIKDKIEEVKRIA